MWVWGWQGVGSGEEFLVDVGFCEGLVEGGGGWRVGRGGGRGGEGRRICWLVSWVLGFGLVGGR